MITIIYQVYSTLYSTPRNAVRSELTRYALRLMSNEFLLSIPLLYKTEWSCELRT